MIKSIPSYAVYPGSVYQPRKVPAYVSQNSRALYYARGGSISDSLLLDQSPLNSGTRRTGEEGRCYTADGIVDNVNLGTDFIGTSDITLTAWINTASFGLAGEGRIFDNGKTIFFVNLVSNRLRFTSDGGANQARADNVITLGQWQHIAVVRVGDVATLYVNGVDATAASSAGTPVVASANLIMLNNASNTRAFDGSIFDARIYNKALTAAEISYIYTFGESGNNPTNANLLAQYKCDEQSGTTAYDSSGNGNNGTLTNITAGTFHATQDIWSFQNQVGFNTSGAVYIPRDESDPANDVLGNPLTNTGRRPNDAALHSSNCLTADGTLYIAAAHLAGAETVVSYGGTSTPSISAGRIDFTAGTCWDLTLSDGTHYPLSEGWGVDIGSSTSDNDGVLTNSILANAWGATQNEYHYNLINGFSLYEHASTAAIRWPFKNGSVKTLTPPTGYSKTSDNYPGDYHNNAETLIDLDPDSTPEMGATQLGITVPASHAFGDAFAASTQIFSRQRTLTEDRFVVMPEAQTGSALATIQRYTQP